MGDKRKQAYRLILYLAMLYIRPIEHYLDFDLKWIGGFSWRKRRRCIRLQGAVANWLHNLARFSALDFEGFNEANFWEDFERLKKAHSEIPAYRDAFERWLNDPPGEMRQLFP